MNSIISCYSCAHSLELIHSLPSPVPATFQGVTKRACYRIASSDLGVRKSIVYVILYLNFILVYFLKSICEIPQKRKHLVKRCGWVMRGLEEENKQWWKSTAGVWHANSCGKHLKIFFYDSITNWNPRQSDFQKVVFKSLQQQIEVWLLLFEFSFAENSSFSLFLT